MGAAEVAAAAPDGYTLPFAATCSLVWPPMTQNVPYDQDSFVYVGQITEYQQAIVAKADAPFDTLAALVEHTRTHSLNYADQSAMSRAYIDDIGAEEGVEGTGIPTKGGEMVPIFGLEPGAQIFEIHARARSATRDPVYFQRILVPTASFILTF